MRQHLKPVYPLTEGLSAKTIEKAVRQALESLPFFKETLPPAIRSKYHLAEYHFALEQIHFPENREQMLLARRRLVFDEFYLFILALRQPIAWDAKDMELDAGTIDCIWNGFTMNGREDDYEWSKPYMKNNQVFVVRGDSDINSEADLAGKNVEVQTDSSAEAALNDNSELTSTFGSLTPVADYNTAFMDLESGAVDAIAMDDVVASYQITSRKADFKVLDDVIAAEEYGIGFKKGNTGLRDKVQATLEEMAADGTAAKISEKWFGKDITTIQ